MPAREIVHSPKLLAGIFVSRRGREPDMNTVGGRIQSARVARGLTMDQLATKVGVTKSSISQWESGKISNLTADNLLKLSNILQVSARWIWLGKDQHGNPLPMGMPAHLEVEE